MNTDSLFQEIQQLPEADRWTLISRVLETLPPEDPSAALTEEEWLDELDRRYNDREGTISWTDLRAE